MKNLILLLTLLPLLFLSCYKQPEFKPGLSEAQKFATYDSIFVYQYSDNSKILSYSVKEYTLQVFYDNGIGDDLYPIILNKPYFRITPSIDNSINTIPLITTNTDHYARLVRNK